MPACTEDVRVSAVIPAYNAEHFISIPIESILAQTYQVAEIIVVDDGSTDRTAEVAGRFPKTQVIRRSNGGQAAARNTGIQNASGEWIAFLDHDDAWLPHKTEVQLQHIAPDVGVIHANQFDPIHFGNLWHRQAHITPSGAMVRKRTLIEVGGFEESRAILGVEDLTMWLKIALTPWRFVRSSSSVFEWRNTGQNQSANEGRMARAELSSIAITGQRVNCDPREIERIQQASRIEYAMNLIARRQWDEATELLKECTPGYASRWLSMAISLKARPLARKSVVQKLHCLDAEYGSHACSATCNLPDTVRRLCIESCNQPYFRTAPRPAQVQKDGRQQRLDFEAS